MSYRGTGWGWGSTVSDGWFFRSENERAHGWMRGDQEPGRMCHSDHCDALWGFVPPPPQEKTTVLKCSPEIEKLAGCWLWEELSKFRVWLQISNPNQARCFQLEQFRRSEKSNSDTATCSGGGLTSGRTEKLPHNRSTPSTISAHSKIYDDFLGEMDHDEIDFCFFTRYLWLRLYEIYSKLMSEIKEERCFGGFIRAILQ